jgi:hypothetical protein
LAAIVPISAIVWLRTIAGCVGHQEVPVGDCLTMAVRTTWKPNSAAMSAAASARASMDAPALMTPPRTG